MILIPLFATALLLFLYQALNKFKVGVVSYLIFVYFCSIVCSLVLYLFFDYSESYILEFEHLRQGFVESSSLLPRKC